jgi:hypothetical protein
LALTLAMLQTGFGPILRNDHDGRAPE